MKNILGREVDFNPYEGPFENVEKKEYKIEKNVDTQKVKDINDLFQKLDMQDGMTISFHHHLRNGDYVLNLITEEIHRRKLKDLTLAASSIFECHAPLVDMIEDGTITNISTSYMKGPVADAVSMGKLKNPAFITTHGGRPRSILENELNIDVAFIAAPCVDLNGAISGSYGKSACGSMGYAVADCQKAKKVVAVTDNLVEKIENPDLEAHMVDYILVVDSIGDPAGIVSGTTQVTKDPIGLKIARDTAKLVDEVGLLENGFSFQTGAGGISLACADEIRKIMEEKNIKGSFGSGGITGYFVDMLEEGLFDELFDVQCFDQRAVESTKVNKKHIKISGSKYANPNDDCIAEKLSCAILGASEIDKKFNVNVTTGSDGRILGGSGGHADIATGSKFSIITTKLFNARVSAVVDEVRTITTPGDVVDALVTEYGIAINPRHKELIDKLKRNSNLNIVTIEELYDIAVKFTKEKRKRERGDKVVAYSVFRDGTILDNIYQVI